MPRPARFQGGVLIIDKATRVNDRIRVKEVRLIEADGSQAGIVPIEDALRRAQEQVLDLVEVAPAAKPPVCRIMDFGKFLYQQKKKAHDSRKKQKTIQVKEVKFRPNIDDHDYGFKLKNVIRFLGEGDKVKATVQFRGREMARTDLGHKLLARVAQDVGERGVVESSPEMAGNRMHVILGPPRHGIKKATP
jgi:translation initiation factor IF-3